MVNLSMLSIVENGLQIILLSVRPLLDFRDPRQRDIALSMDGVSFYGRKLRVEIFERRDDVYAKKKKYLCRYFAGQRCQRTKERCPFAHGVLDLKLYNDTRLHKDRCMYITQIESRYFGIDLLNLVEDKFNNEHRGEPQLIITALHYRQQMGDALIEFGSHMLKSMAYDLLNGLKWGSQTLAIHPWESRYQGTFLDYFDRNVHTEIKVQKGTPPVVPVATALPRRISQSEDSRKDLFDPQRMQVRTSGHIDPVVAPAAALPRRISQEPPSPDIRKVLFDPRQQDPSQRMQAPRGDLCDPSITGNDCPASSVSENLDHNREHDGSVSTSCTMETVSTDNNDPEVSVTTDHQTRNSSRPVEDIVRNWLTADRANGRGVNIREIQHEGTLDSAPSEDLQAVPPLRPAGELNRNQEDREPGGLQLQDTVVTDQQEEANMGVVSQDQNEESEEGITETNEEVPEPTESQQDENSLDLLEASNEDVQGSELRGEHQPLRGTCHPAPADDPEIDRMRKEIVKLKSEQAEKDQLIEDLKKQNTNLEAQLNASRTDARLHLEKLSEEQRKLSEMEEEFQRLRQEVTNDLLPKLKRKEEQTKQLKIEVYDLLKVRGDVLAEIKKLSGGHDRIKSDQDNSVSGNNHVSEDHTAINFSTILEVQKYLDEASAYVKEKEAETERLRDENTTLEEEMEQMRMCRAMEMGFVAGKGPDGDDA